MPTSPNAITSTTQEFLDIFDITNDLVLLKSGAASLVLTVTAMNFGLLAEEEQDGIIYGYASLLNSLNYPIEIVIRSQTKDISSYLGLLKQKEDETINRTRKDQIRRYREFVADLVQERNVLDKKFYVVIPASGLELGIVTAQSVIPGVKSPDISSFDRSMIVERARNLLEPKRDHLIAQFARIGLYGRQLATQELIQLFYTIYNTESSDGQRMTDSRNYTPPMVEGSWETERVSEVRDRQPDNLQVFPTTPAPQTQQPAPEVAPLTVPAQPVVPEPVVQAQPAPAPMPPQVEQPTQPAPAAPVVEPQLPPAPAIPTAPPAVNASPLSATVQPAVNDQTPRMPLGAPMPPPVELN